MTLKSTAKDVAERFGVTDQARDAYRKISAAKNIERRKRNARWLERGAPDGLPTPPEALIYYVAGHNDYELFWIDGDAHARNIRDTFAAYDVELAEQGAIFDWGCGCGRVLRHWAGLGGPAISGSDYNPELVSWCDANLPFADVRLNQLDPPLPFETDTFDALYAISVFTHLDAVRQEVWLAEVARVLKPGGTAMLTVHGENATHLLIPADRAQFDAGELVVHAAKNAGANVCSAYHPTPYIEDVFGRHFDVLGIAPTPLRGSVQDAVMVRKR
jgi:SAM-dependent methyltransferase